MGRRWTEVWVWLGYGGRARVELGSLGTRAQAEVLGWGVLVYSRNVKESNW